MTTRTCIDCGALTQATRCTICARLADRRRGSADQRGYGTAWRTLRAKLLRGSRCVVCGHPGSTDNPLSLDHILPKARGGSDDPRNLQPLCRQHNSAKGTSLGRTSRRW
jgi:5-methylcytosine-specific restriction protein A